MCFLITSENPTSKNFTKSWKYSKISLFLKIHYTSRYLTSALARWVGLFHVNILKSCVNSVESA